jgi:hypothetical protein
LILYASAKVLFLNCPLSYTNNWLALTDVKLTSDKALILHDANEAHENAEDEEEELILSTISFTRAFNDTPYLGSQVIKSFLK